MSTLDSRVLAGPIGDCCVQAVKHTGDTVGKSITIAGVETYSSEPPKDAAGPKKIILYLADVFGPFYPNSKLLQDYFASNGYTVLGPDYFFGDPIHLQLDDPKFDRDAWFAKSKAKADEAFPKWLKEVRKTYGTDVKYTAVGYCFGAPYATDLAATDDVVAAAFAHPAGLTEDQFRKVKKPLLLSCAENDFTFSSDSRRRAEDILAEIKATYHVQVFSGVSHGFATKGDPSVENIRWAKEESARSVIRWFKRFTK